MPSIFEPYFLLAKKAQYIHSFPFCQIDQFLTQNEISLNEIEYSPNIEVVLGKWLTASRDSGPSRLPILRMNQAYRDSRSKYV